MGNTNTCSELRHQEQKHNLLVADMLSSSSTANVRVFALTGGPCGGKTTAIVKVAERLRSLGYQVFVVPEIATIYHHAGLAFPAGQGEKPLLAFETSYLKMQMSFEDNFKSFAQSTDKPTIILCDRGTMDVKAYLSEEHWERILTDNTWNYVELRDRRYDGIVHLVTAADGAIDFYTKSNNAARRESPQEAIRLDQQTKEAWLGHPALKIIPNSGDFNNKMNSACDYICSILGIPSPLISRRKFVVTIDANAKLDYKYQDCTLESTFIKTENGNQEVVVRKRGQNGQYSYTLSVVTRNAAATAAVVVGESAEQKQSTPRVVTQRTIDEVTYLNFLQQADSSLQSVVRNRRCFLHNQHYFELDSTSNVDQKSQEYVLIVEANPSENIEMPTWITSQRELKQDSNIVLSALAQKQSLSTLS